MPITDDIKSAAYKAGFHAVGITTAQPFYKAQETLKEKWEGGLLTGSGYNPEVINLYTHPHKTLPGARSIISVALSYLTEDAPAPQTGSGPRGLVARFSRGMDYHPIMQERLSQLSARIREIAGRPCRVLQAADTGPFADRAVAVRAGVGSQGKNTCLYTKDWGSWVVLGEIITDLPLTPDAPAPPRLCGDCNKCIKACPTGAISRPYTVDLRLCLSQVTQMKGFIPPPLREKMGARIYGCDTCQNACPLNAKAGCGGLKEFAQTSGIGEAPELIPLLQMTNAEFKKRVSPTTAGWIGRTRIRRNAAVALGNIGDSAAIPALLAALADPSPIIRGHSAWALAKIGGREAGDALLAALAREPNPDAALEIKNALEAF
jgi:epoxyqueuosine reductase